MKTAIVRVQLSLSFFRFFLHHSHLVQLTIWWYIWLASFYTAVGAVIRSLSTLTYIGKLMSFWSAHTHAHVLDLPPCCCSCRPTLLGEQFVTINWVIHMHNYRINVRARIDFENWLYIVFNVGIWNNRYMLDHIQLSAFFFSFLFLLFRHFSSQHSKLNTYLAHFPLAMAWKYESVCHFSSTFIIHLY